MGTRVYIGRLSMDVRERDIERFFKGYGRIKEILIKNGFGFVDFDDYRDADDAVYELNGKELLGERVILEIARGPTRRTGRFGYRRRGGWIDKSSSYGGGNNRSGYSRYGPPHRTEYRVIVKNLSSRISWQDLKDYMRQAGEVTYADAHKHHQNEGSVDFATYSDMKKAISKLDGTELNGREIKVVEDKSHRRSSKRSRSRSSSRSRSRSRSNSRRRSRRSHSASKSRSKTRSRSKSRSKTRSESGSPKKVSEGSRSRSRSKTPDEDSKRGASASPENRKSESPQMRADDKEGSATED